MTALHPILVQHRQATRTSRLDPVEQAIADIAAGRPVVVVDDEDRENEGDLVIAAEKATPEIVAFMMSECRGLICAPMEGDELDRLELPQMVERQHRVDADRLHRLRRRHPRARRHHRHLRRRPRHHAPAARRAARPGRRLRPPRPRLPAARQARRRARPQRPHRGRRRPRPARGAAPGRRHRRDRRRGRRDAAAARADPVRPQARPDDHLHRGPDRLPPQPPSPPSAARPRPDCPPPSASSRAYGYRSTVDGVEHIALVHGEIGDGEDVLVRVHSECLTGDIFHSLRCDCGPQLQASLERIQAEGRGVVRLPARPRGPRHRAAVQAARVRTPGARPRHPRRQPGARACPPTPATTRGRADPRRPRRAQRCG